MVACPFGVPTYEWEKPAPWVRKCTFCADRQAAGQKPACVTTCPTGALTFGDREELIIEARKRIAAAPYKYVDHIYGEKEAGGTSWMYLSPVSFDKLGFRDLPTDAVTVNVNHAMEFVPPVLVGVAAVMAGFYWVIKRRIRMGEDTTKIVEKEEVTK